MILPKINNTLKISGIGSPNTKAADHIAIGTQEQAKEIMLSKL